MPAFLTNKVGPLPTWAWMLAGVGVIIFVKMRQSASAAPPVVPVGPPLPQDYYGGGGAGLIGGGGGNNIASSGSSPASAPPPNRFQAFAAREGNLPTLLAPTTGTAPGFGSFNPGPLPVSASSSTNGGGPITQASFPSPSKVI